MNPPTEEEFERTSLDLRPYVEKQVRKIIEQVDKMTIHNVPTETLLKIKTKIDEELKNREILRKMGVVYI